MVYIKWCYEGYYMQKTPERHVVENQYDKNQATEIHSEQRCNADKKAVPHSSNLRDEDIRILIVEDNLSNLKIIRNQLLPKLPYHVTVVDDGTTAVAKVLEMLTLLPKEAPYHIYFIDQQMPKMAGNIATHIINYHLRSHHLPELIGISISSEIRDSNTLKKDGLVADVGKLKKASQITEMVNQYVRSSKIQRRKSEDLSAIHSFTGTLFVHEKPEKLHPCTSLERDAILRVTSLHRSRVSSFSSPSAPSL